MKQKDTNLGLQPVNFFLLRSPLLPFEDWLNWTKSSEMEDRQDTAGIHEKLTRDKKTMRHQLSRKLRDPGVSEALYLSSSTLFKTIDNWEREPDTKAGFSAECSLVAFFSRICSRSSPFGLNAGVSHGVVGDKTILLLGPRHQYQKKSSIDIRYLRTLRNAALSSVVSNKSLNIHVNPTLYVKSKQARYLEQVQSTTGPPFITYRSVAVTLTHELEAILNKARDGADVETLLNCILEPTDDRRDGEIFLQTLINEQILFSELDPILSGPDPAVEFLQQVRKLGQVGCKISSTVEAILEHLAMIDRKGIGCSTLHHEALGSIGRNGTESDRSNPSIIHMDLLKPAAVCVLGRDIIAEMAKGVKALCCMGEPANTALRQFVKSFREKFGDRVVPLLEALDDEDGVPFDPNTVRGPATVLKGMPGGIEEPETSTWSRRDRTLLRLVFDASSSGHSVIDLQERDLNDLAGEAPVEMPTCLSVLATVFSGPSSSPRKDDFRILLEAYTSSAALLGRFCSSDPGLSSRVAEMLQLETENLDVILADIIHYPAGPNLGNVLSRPQLLNFAIPVHGRCSLPLNKQIPLTDLMVSIDHDDNVILSSVKHRKRIIPRLTNAHNFGSTVNLPIYRFLCALQFGPRTVASKWSWGRIFESFSFLPRVTVGRTVLARAQWRLDQTEIDWLCHNDETLRYIRFQEWRGKRRVPRFVFSTEGDRMLPIDLENILCINVLVRSIRSASESTLVEMLPTPEELILQGPEGHFQHQVVVPFFSTTQPIKPKDKGIAVAPSASISQYVCPPGSMWIYVKIYASPSASEAILANNIGPIISEAQEMGRIRRWFFIRYDEGGHHLRIRLLCSDNESETLLSNKLRASLSYLVDQKLASSIQFDTYLREVTRYGGIGGIQFAEEIFHSDSEYVLGAITSGVPYLVDNERWLTALIGIDRLCSDFELTLSGKLDLMANLRNFSRSEFQAEGPMRHHISRQFIERRNLIVATLLEEKIATSLVIRSRSIHDTVKRIKSAIAEDQIARTLPDLLSSYIHMHVNRILRNDHRRHELILYDWLYRAYDSIAKRTARNEHTGSGMKCLS